MCLGADMASEAPPQTVPTQMAPPRLIDCRGTDVAVGQLGEEMDPRSIQEQSWRRR